MSDYAEARGKTYLEEKQTLQIFIQIAVGLKDIHMKRVVHRDIKHKNIFLSNAGKKPSIKIADFGLACILKDNECF